MKATLQHQETWTLTITRDEDDEDWPDAAPVPYSGTGRVFVPESITVILKRGHSYPAGTISGKRLKIDGTPGVLTTKFRTYGQSFSLTGAAWADDIVRNERRRLRLGPAETGCGW